MIKSTVFWFTIYEIRALARILEREYINPENTGAYDVVNKLFKIVRESENEPILDRHSSKSTP